MSRALRVVSFLVLTFVGLLLLGAPSGRAFIGTLALAALRATPVPRTVVYGFCAVVFGLGILQWATGVVITR